MLRLQGIRPGGQGHEAMPGVLQSESSGEEESELGKGRMNFRSSQRGVGGAGNRGFRHSGALK